MRKLLIAGIGNVLLGDDGVGPFVIKVLESQYDFAEGVELADLGTPGFDLLVHLSGADAVILVDSAKFGGRAGDIRLFHREDILRIPAAARIDPHSPALRETLSQLELMGTMPGELLLIGIQGSCFEPGSQLSSSVRQCIPHAIDAVRRELDRLDIGCAPKASAGPTGIWWDSIYKEREVII
jgi:hydrogenase maturation protease